MILMNTFRYLPIPYGGTTNLVNIAVTLNHENVTTKKKRPLQLIIVGGNGFGQGIVRVL